MKPQAPEEILRKLTREKVTINFHENCLTPTNFTKYGDITLTGLTSFEILKVTIYFRYNMNKFWKPLSYNYDRNKLKYISTIEAHEYPFVGVQFHPEKNIFEWATGSRGNIPHNRYNDE